MTRVPANRYFVFFLLVAAGLTGDLYSKHLVFRELAWPGKSSGLLLDGWITFQLFTSFNEGALWGVGQGYAWLFAILSVAAIVGVIYWLFVRGAAVSLWLTVSLGSVMAGTLGNLYDRLGLHGCVHPETGGPWYAVRDFLLFTFGGYHFPVFNFADAFLVTGAIMLFVQSFRGETETHVSTAAELAKRADHAETNARRSTVCP